MQKSRKALVIMLAVFACVVSVQDMAFAQTPTMALNLTAGEMGIVILVGAGAGILHAYQGYRTGKEDFDRLKFFDGIINCTLASIPLAIAAAVDQAMTGVPITIFGYVTMFFAALGLGFQLQQSRKPTIPSNATT